MSPDNVFQDNPPETRKQTMSLHLASNLTAVADLYGIPRWRGVVFQCPLAMPPFPI
jgi:hypothetical protein